MERIQTVTEITKSIKGLLETGFAFIAVVGEISNLRVPSSGHMYFTLKDSESQLKAVMFKMQQRYLSETPQDGQQVICRGRISVYEPRGEYQCIVDTLEFYGPGSLQRAFEQLKQKLANEGLFDVERKRPLPRFPQKIGLVTSPKGAAVHDFLKIARSRFPLTQIEIYPVRVQGDFAAGEIIAALDTVNDARDTQIIVICRGGGSIEDLWAFNDEALARNIAASTIPVVTAIGHETDFTIADFVADYRAPTPSAAAEAILPDQKQIRENIRYLKERLANLIAGSIREGRHQLNIFGRMLKAPSAALEHYYLRVDHAKISLQNSMARRISLHKHSVYELSNRIAQQNPGNRLELQRLQLAGKTAQLVRSLEQIIAQRRTQLQKSAALLDSVSPLAILARGYSITRSSIDGRTIKTSQDVAIGDTVDVTLHRGELSCEVKEVK